MTVTTIYLKLTSKTKAMPMPETTTPPKNDYKEREYIEP